MSRSAVVILSLLVPLAAVLCGGCETARRAPVTVHAGSAGASAAAVMVPVETAVILAHLPPGPEVARRDDALAVRTALPALATNQWPQHRRPSITETRRLFLQDRDGTFLFFLPEDWWWGR